MVHGENRAKLKQMTLHAGEGIKHFGSSTLEAFMKPSLIPEKVEHAVDHVFVQPKRRTVDFFEESTHHSRQGPGRVGHGGLARRLKVVFQRPLGDASFTAPDHPKTPADAALLDDALLHNVVFAGLSSSKRAKLIPAFEPATVDQGAEIIAEGDAGDYLDRKSVV